MHTRLFLHYENSSDTHSFLAEGCNFGSVTSTDVGSWMWYGVWIHFSGSGRKCKQQHIHTFLEISHAAWLGKFLHYKLVATYSERIWTRWIQIMLLNSQTRLRNQYSGRRLNNKETDVYIESKLFIFKVQIWIESISFSHALVETKLAVDKCMLKCEL